MWRTGLLFVLGVLLNPTAAVTATIALYWLGIEIPLGIEQFFNDVLGVYFAFPWVVSVHVAVFLGVVGYLVEERTWVHALNWVAVSWCLWAVCLNIWQSWLISGIFGANVSFSQATLAEWRFTVIVIIGLAVGAIMGRVGRKRKSWQLAGV